jgi:Flp pilus assembly secretin CpaC
MTAVLRACALGLAFLSSAISTTRAADQTITLRLGAGSPLALERAFKSVLIGDPLIVDVQTRTDRSVVLEPLSLGATNLVFIDGESVAIVNVRILVCNAGAIRISYPDRADCE